jgi:hypothetical protein
MTAFKIAKEASMTANYHWYIEASIHTFKMAIQGVGKMVRNNNRNNKTKM